MVYKFFDKKFGSVGIVNGKLAEELHKLVTKKSKRSKVYAIFKDNIRSGYLAQMRSLCPKNRNVKCFYVSQMVRLNMGQTFKT